MNERPWYDLYQKIRAAGLVGLIIMALHFGADATDIEFLDQITADEGKLASGITWFFMLAAGYLKKEKASSTGGND